ncbi:hypothetical protein NPIL_196221 [Nephila pilipes]|uniref:Uncharacterized protein n=1 Tax=Nephila pilipes TaxID=299642 RepID=A0A8X6UTF5_NEPPI|nr:hypothetical protein NPIL_196221 [Nephila pilipes]
MKTFAFIEVSLKPSNNYSKGKTSLSASEQFLITSIGSASNICETMALSDPRVLSLRQVAMVKTAVAVCNDPEIQDFVKVHGSSSFAFPSKEVKVFLKEMEIPPHHDWAWKEISFDEHSSNCRGFHFPLKKDHIDRWTTTDDILTFGKWEELVDKKITSLVLPLQLQSELIEVFRFVTAEIYTWITNHAVILSSAAEIAHTNLHYFHWNWIGKIDPVETARSMLKSRRLPTEIHDIIAINYGFVADLITNQNTNAVGIDQNVGRSVSVKFGMLLLVRFI